MDYYSSLDSRFLDSETPTLFEIISSQQLDQLLTPSIRYILVYYTHRYPQIFIKLLNRFDELNLLVRGGIEYQFLKNWNSSFIEKFYGLKRCNTKNYLKDDRIPLEIREKKKRLTRAQLLISVFEVVGVPYLREKLDTYYDRLYSKFLTNNVSASERLFIKAYPFLKFVLQFGNFVALLSLLNGKNKSPTLLSWLASIRYSRLNLYDYDLNEQKKVVTKNITPVRPPTPRQSLFRLTLLTLGYSKSLAYFISNKIFPISMFLLKFLEWWNSSEFVSKLKQTEEINIDHPPTTDSKFQYKEDGSCPLCHKPISNPLLLDTGYVFCYSCIHNHLNSLPITSAPRCPISGQLLLNCVLGPDNNWRIECLRRLMV